MMVTTYCARGLVQLPLRAVHQTLGRGLMPGMPARFACSGNDSWEEACDCGVGGVDLASKRPLGGAPNGTKSCPKEKAPPRCGAGLSLCDRALTVRHEHGSSRATEGRASWGCSNYRLPHL